MSRERQLAHLRELGQEPAINHSVNRKRIIVETERYLNGLARCVREGKRADEAARYVRWLQFSGIFNLLREEDSFRLQADVLYKQSEELLAECGELFKGGKVDPRYAESDIVEINRKLDMLARFIDATPVRGNSASQNELAPGSEV